MLCIFRVIVEVLWRYHRVRLGHLGYRLGLYHGVSAVEKRSTQVSTPEYPTFMIGQKETQGTNNEDIITKTIKKNHYYVNEENIFGPLNFLELFISSTSIFIVTSINEKDLILKCYHSEMQNLTSLNVFKKFISNHWLL